MQVTREIVSGRRKRRYLLALASGSAALGGLLFGFDTGIISGALLYISSSFGLDAGGQQIVVSVLLLGAILGVVASGTILDKIGRKRTLVLLAAVFAVGAIASSLAPDFGILVAARFVLGVAVGASSNAVPVYIAEISPAAIRGRLVAMYQLMVAVGIAVSYLVAFLLSSGQHWRLMLGVAAIPAVAMLVGVLVLPESPRWLVSRNRRGDARNALARLVGSADEVECELDAFAENIANEQRVSFRSLLRKPYRSGVAICVTLAATNQLVGVNAVIYYAPTLLVQAGLGQSAALLSTVGIGIATVVVTFAALLLVDKVGRRPLVLVGTGLTILSLVFIGAIYLLPDPSAFGPLLVVGLVIYIVAFCGSLGISIWLINSEVFPSAIRGRASSFGAFTHWTLDFVVALTVLTLFDHIGPTGLFWLYAGFGLVGFLILKRRLPETRGRSLEEIDMQLRGEKVNA